MIDRIREFSEKFVSIDKNINKNNDRVVINNNIKKWYYYNTDIVTINTDKKEVTFNLCFTSVSTSKRLRYAVSALNLKYRIAIKNGMYEVRNKNTNDKLEIKNNSITLSMN